MGSMVRSHKGVYKGAPARRKGLSRNVRQSKDALGDEPAASAGHGTMSLTLSTNVVSDPPETRISKYSHGGR
jgi:hypothetical protein